MNIENEFSRTELLIGRESLEKIKNSKIVVCGVGGVGGYALEALARCGVYNLIIIDYDDISISNINRQIIALRDRVGNCKVLEFKERIFKINTEIKVTALKEFITPENIQDLIPKDTDYILDAIDTVKSKLSIIKYATENKIKIISSMAMGNKLNPSIIEVEDIYKTSVCPLARVMRRELKKMGVNRLKVVYSKEEPKKVNAGVTSSIAFVPSVAGLIMAGEAVRDLI